MENDILVISFSDINNDNIFMDSLNNSEGVQSKCVFRSVCKPLRAIRRIHIISGLPGMGIWLLDWKNGIKSNKRIVCIASRYSHFILKWINKKEKTTKLVNYYWDCVDISKYPVKYVDYYENWSFCKSDAEKYNMKYNPQFYVASMRLKNENVIYDASFVGADREGKWKNRIQLVNECYQTLKKNDLKVFFYFVTQSNAANPEIRQNKRLSEHEYNKIVSMSRVIIELVEPGMEWVTLRPLMALTNKKKVITNNKKIVDERYYSKDNFFVLGIDDESRLKEFVFSEFREIDKEILCYYEAKEWSRRFFSED